MAFNEDFGFKPQEAVDTITWPDTDVSFTLTNHELSRIEYLVWTETQLWSAKRYQIVIAGGDSLQ